MLIELGILDTPIHGLTTYSLEMFYCSTLIQSITIYKADPIFTSENFIHPCFNAISYC